jgi:uncharacterized membrane-anchored protein
MTKEEAKEIKELEARLEQLKTDRSDKERVKKLKKEVEKLERGQIKKKKDLFLGSALMVLAILFAVDLVGEISLFFYRAPINEVIFFFKLTIFSFLLGFSLLMVGRYRSGANVDNEEN